jgi:glycosyltransferase involved in cell wall biosynthesis
VDRFVVPSGYASGQLATLGLPPDRIEVLPHYLPCEALRDVSSADRGSYALIASRLSEEKGIDVAIRAAAEVGVPLRIAGEGPAAPALADLAAQERAPVELLGRVGQAEVARLLSGAAMALLPSRYHEFAPYSALEAMGEGVPVVASRLGGLPELIGTDRCVTPNDPEELAGRMRALWEDPEKRREEGETLLNRARERHSRESFTTSLLSLYDRLMTNE